MLSMPATFDVVDVICDIGHRGDGRGVRLAPLGHSAIDLGLIVQLAVQPFVVHPPAVRSIPWCLWPGSSVQT